jgi:hypothetical protein
MCLKVYKVKVTEELVHEFKVLASSEEHARTRAIDMRCDETVTACTELDVEVGDNPQPCPPGDDPMRAS